MEEEAIRWGKAGLVRVKHILRHNEKVFSQDNSLNKQDYPQLQVQYFDYFLKESPSEWHKALSSRANKREPNEDEKM